MKRVDEIKARLDRATPDASGAVSTLGVTDLESHAHADLAYLLARAERLEKAAALMMQLCEDNEDHDAEHEWWVAGYNTLAGALSDDDSEGNND